jgi:AcrR family transcriptional regulator
MGRPRRISDDDIAREARAVFLSEGPGASTEIIARKLGVSQAALFKRVPTKDELLVLALCPRDTPLVLLQLPMGPDLDRSVPQQLTELVRSLLGFFRDLMPALLTLKASGVALERAFPEGKVNPPLKVREDLTMWLKLAHRQRKVRSGDLKPMADLLLGAIESRCLLEHLAGAKASNAQDVTFATEIVRAAWRGLAPDR